MWFKTFLKPLKLRYIWYFVCSLIYSQRKVGFDQNFNTLRCDINLKRINRIKHVKNINFATVAANIGATAILFFKCRNVSNFFLFFFSLLNEFVAFSKDVKFFSDYSHNFKNTFFKKKFSSKNVFLFHI